MSNLAANLETTVRRHRDRPAIRLDEEVLTFAELADRTGRVAGWLKQRGLEPGDRVGVMLPNVAAFPVLYYGICGPVESWSR